MSVFFNNATSMLPFIVYYGAAEKNIFSKEIIAQRWTKQYNTCSNAADFVECEHNVEVAKCNEIFRGQSM